MSEWAAAAGRSPWLPVAAALLALAVRLIRIGERSLWLDEAYAAWLAGLGWPAGLDADVFFPPLYPRLLEGWTSLGAWAASDAGVRVPSALASAAGVGLAVWLIQRLRLPGALLAAGLGVVSSLSVWYAQEARSVALAGTALLVCAAALALQSAPRRGTRPVTAAALWIAYVLAGAFALYLHYGALPVLLALNGVYLVNETLRGGRVRAGGAWLLAQAMLALLYVPQAPRLLRAVQRIESHPYALTYAPFLVGATLALALGLAVLVATGASRVVSRGTVAAAAAGVLVVLYAADLVPAGTTIKRHLALVFPVLLVPLSVAVAGPAAPRWQGALVLAGLPSLLLVLIVHPKEPWRDVAGLLQAHQRPGDAVAVYAPYVAIPLQRYYRGQGAAPPVALAEPDQLAGLTGQPRPPSRLWLVESHAEDLRRGSAAAVLGPPWRLACESRFYRITVSRFVPVAGPEEGAAVAPPCG